LCEVLLGLRIEFFEVIEGALAEDVKEFVAAVDDLGEYFGTGYFFKDDAVKYLYHSFEVDSNKLALEIFLYVCDLGCQDFFQTFQTEVEVVLISHFK
jgi:hypothetical protein